MFNLNLFINSLRGLIIYIKNNIRNKYLNQMRSALNVFRVHRICHSCYTYTTVIVVPIRR